MVNISEWNKNNILKFSIDNTYIDEDLTDFPLLLNISNAAGKNNFNCNNLLEELIIPTTNCANYGVILNFEEGLVDKSLHKNKVIFTGTGGNNSTYYKFGSKSYQMLPGYVSVTMHKGLMPETYDFTLHGWFYLTSIANHTGFFSLGYYTAGLLLVWGTSNSLRLNINGSEPIPSFTWTPPQNVWFHLAVIRSNNYISVYYNGTRIMGPAFYASSILPTRNFDIGRDQDFYNSTFTGYIDEIIMLKNIALWTENFTPPNSPVDTPQLFEKKIAIVYPAVQRHYINNTWITYNHGAQAQLYCEIERWDYPNKSIQLWVKIPKILANQPTDILLYYDNTQPDNADYIGFTSEFPAKQVWSNNFAGVFHLSQNPALLNNCMLDSSINSNHGTPTTTLLATDLVDGVTGKAINFESASSDMITISNSSYLSMTTNLTIEGFVKQPVLSATTVCIAHKGNLSTSTAGEMYSLYKDTTNTLYFKVNDNAGSISGSNLVENEWINLAATYDMSSQKILKNGITVVSGSYTTQINSATTNIYIGRYRNTASTGIIKEVRISNVARTTAWIKATNYTCRDQLNTISNATIFKISGNVTALGNVAQRDVCLYERNSGELVYKTISDENGFYEVYTENASAHNIVCYDNEATPHLNDLIISKVTPVEEV